MGGGDSILFVLFLKALKIGELTLSSSAYVRENGKRGKEGGGGGRG